MPTTLICPGERPAVGFLAQAVPLVAIPILGESLLAYWIEHLARNGTRHVRVLATDRPEIIRSLLGNGSRWGVQLDLRAELKELSPTEAAAQWAEDKTPGPVEVITLDYLPGMPEIPLFRSYRDWYQGVLAWVPRATRGDRIGLREIEPGVWCGSRAQIASGAILRPPCWLGHQVQVGTDTVIGPDAILEDRVVVDAASEVRSSVIGPDTFVGRLVKVESSIAWGSTLIDWKTGSCTQVPDSFLLSSLGQRYLPQPERRPAARWRRLWKAVSGWGRPWPLSSSHENARQP